ncbi:conserved Plasmodium protein, unknown function [Plasmodium gallinaceum]|uniref:NAD(+) kinase n=1 Tax=Plasmodium gallinaceum TaxID=5849 RepID=A0A1J1GZF6_PLAGA|nr:conserved Plasmodium protein, unknown function [Plasmodium gallinaceum]CRG96681.1 conserved Plasmodium protein, unknown function [Plasmodium gallinaceum]
MQSYLTKHTRKINVYKLSNINNWKMMPYVNEQRFLRRNNSIRLDKSFTDAIKKDEEKKKNNNVIDSICSDYSNKTKNEFSYNIIPNEMYKKKYERILLIEKYTKYDDLKKQGFKDDYILKNFFRIYISHFTHTLIVNNIIHILRTKYKSHVSILKAYKKNIDNIFISSSSVFSPDAIFSVGGDGTYLESAHIIANKYIIDENTNRKNKRIELIGINSDPKGSEGKLCLDYLNCEPGDEINYDYESFEQFEKIYNRRKKKANVIFTDVSNFIKKSKEKEKKKAMNNENEKVEKEEKIFENISAIDNILRNNSLRYDELTGGPSLKSYDDFHFYLKNKNNINEEKRENEDNKKSDSFPDKIDFLSNEASEKHENLIISVEEYAKKTLKNFFETDKYKKIYRKYITVLIKKSDKEVKTYKSINEVYIYEAVKNNICTYINIDNKILKKLKSTALLITSGTGSTAWAYNVNKIDKKKMKNIIEEFLNSQNDIVKKNIKNINFDLFSEYINSSICFHPSSKYMKCIVKEPVENNVYDSTDHIYNCKYINIKICTSNTIVYIDGIYNIKIQPNDSVILHIKDDDFIVTYK